MNENKKIFTVSELTQDIRLILEDSFSDIWVEGEISNFSKSSAGHIYFSLKDPSAILKCAFFRSVNQNVKFELKDGMQAVCFGKISVYDKSGQYQLYVERIEPKGVGALQVAFEQLKAKLQKEGLFDEARKRPIPYLPTRIGIVTSPTGAAIRDILNVVKERFQNVEVILSPVKVQGEGSKEEIAGAIDDFNFFNEKMPKEKQVSVLIVGRGGGSLEDLWAFNEEIVARAIYTSKIPVISAVGHEIDWTISDFVADRRAKTPTDAAQIVIPKKSELTDRIDEVTQRLDNSISNTIIDLQEKLKSLSESYILKQPINIIESYQQRIDELNRSVEIRAGHIFDIKSSQYTGVFGKLQMLSPFKVLKRGYSITTSLDSGKVIKDGTILKNGDKLKTKFEIGEAVSEVKNG